MGQASIRFTNALLRRFAPARPEQLLTEDEMAALAPRINRLNKYAAAVVAVSMGSFTAAFTYVMNQVDLATQEPLAGTTYCDRMGAIWVGSGMFISLVVSYLPVRMFIRWWMRGDLELHDRYESTRTGWDHRWEFFVTCLIAALAGVPLTAAAWHRGTVVDAQGIRLKPGFWSVYHHAYGDVVAVGLYDEFEAPIGIRNVPNLEVEFRTGPPLRLQCTNRRLQPAQLETIAAFISERTGIAIKREQLRP